MANGDDDTFSVEPRTRAWAGYPQDVKIGLLIEDQDKLEKRYLRLATSTAKRLDKIETRTAWLVGLFVMILTGVLANLIVFLATR